VSKPDQIGSERFMNRKESALALGCSGSTVKRMEREGAFTEVRRLRGLGWVSYLASAEGKPLLSPAWILKNKRESEGSMAHGHAGEGGGQVVTIDSETIRFALRETGAMIANLPPIPDPAAAALERGEPDIVVAERVRARGIFWLGFWFCAGLVVAALVGATAYLRRHKILPALL
jgi:hypothetical protein